MTPRSLARLQATGRVVLGAGIAAAPSLVAGGWVGAVADKPGGRALATGLGARDVAIALGTAAALRNGHGARPWLRAGMLADAADLVATLRARDALAPIAVPVVVAMAGGSVLLGAWLQRELD
jgi:hypothetical protein